LFITYFPSVVSFFSSPQDKQAEKKILEQELEKKVAMDNPKKKLIIRRWFPDFRH
jgi:hypothetical protein